MNIFKDLFLDLQYVPLFAGLSAFVMSTCFYLYPCIIKVSKQKGLMDATDNRKIHKDLTPTLGGLGVFIVFSLSIIFYGLFIDLVHTDLIKLLVLLGSAIILFFLGVKDDLVPMSPKKKFLGQLLAVLNVVVFTDVRIIGFEGLLGVGELPYFLSIIFSIFVFILIINALNLIDGIDGLAGLISVISSLVFGILFFIHEHYLMTLISAILIGSILGFLRYNLSSNQKIFMGDCGSMLAGFLLAYQGVSFIALNSNPISSTFVSNTPVLLIAILSYPLFDLLRVFAIRIKQGRSPFSADSNHIHHRLLRIGLSHKEATFLLSILSIIVIGCSFLFNSLDVHLHLLITVCIGSLIYLAPFLKIFDKQVDASVTESSKETAAAVLQYDVIMESGINLDSSKYSKGNDTEDSLPIVDELELDKNLKTEVLKSDFTSIIKDRRQNLDRERKKQDGKTSSDHQEILDQNE
ncbi:MAG: UDP-GlcNAc:undecaprenyl-phosphate GlcNAc-1-phosphate transferase [Maribacter sp.]|jgi:UDP-N-acetylmuramyl pentapeptide phosphotransferase/UDP-N-acetylglucosamine-1-phosphate transferase